MTGALKADVPFGPLHLREDSAILRLPRCRPEFVIQGIIVEIKDLIKKASEYLPPKDVASVEQAYQFAREAGKPNLEDALEVGWILAHLQMDAECLAASLLQGLPENAPIPFEKASFAPGVKKLVGGINRVNSITRSMAGTLLRIRSEDRESPGEKTTGKFTPGVKKLIEGVNKMTAVPLAISDQTQAENLRKMFMAMAEDIRVIIISLANRLQVMRNLKEFDPELRAGISQETMEIYVPLAHRLGIHEIKGEMEDIAFRTLHPEAYKEIITLLDVKEQEWRRAIAQAIRVLKEEFKKAGIEAEIEGRSKGVYSIYKKMQRYAEQGKEITDIHDLMAVRVLVKEVRDCYSALGIVHHLWHPLPGQFDDYIANPKEGIYQSLHTTVMALQGKPLEIQIRTYEMHRTNEYGMAAHWRYKEGEKTDKRFEEKMAWIRQLMEWQKDLSGSMFVEAVKTDIFQDQVYVFTPTGEVKELPQGSTPLDFAYRIHTELGHRCTGAKVNGKLVPLTYQLQNGDVVDILSTKAARGPSLDWLNPDAGYVKSSHAREKIRQWFRRAERSENLERGREVFEREIKRLGITVSLQDAAKAFGYEDANDLLIALGCGDISAPQLALKLVPEEKPEEEEPLPLPTTPEKPHLAAGVQVLGVGDLLTQIARCCNPVPGDAIIGFVSRTRGVIIHRKDCPNIVNTDEPERLISVTWGPQMAAHPVALVIEAEDRLGLLRDITTLLTESKINIASLSTVNRTDGTASIHLTVEMPDTGYLPRLLTRLERVKGVLSATRSTIRPAASVTERPSAPASAHGNA